MNCSILVYIRKINDFLWPYLEKSMEEDKVLSHNEFLSDKGKITETDWGKSNEIALEEARRLNDVESERKKSAEVKAGIYLAAVTALAPVLTSLITSLWNEKLNFFVNLFSLMMFFFATVYLLNSGVWAFRALRVSMYHRIDVEDLSKIWLDENPKVLLVKQILISVRANRNGVNKKISCIKMTHEFLLRSFICFILVLLIQTVAVSISIDPDLNKNSNPREYYYRNDDLKDII